MTAWSDGYLQIEQEAKAGRCELNAAERWKAIGKAFAAEIAEQTRLSDLQEPHLERMDQLIKEMWATPARTADERRTKVEVLLVCIMRDDWREHDDVADYDIRMARRLLIEFVGEQPADILADQFSSGAKTCA